MLELWFNTVMVIKGMEVVLWVTAKRTVTES